MRQQDVVVLRKRGLAMPQVIEKLRLVQGVVNHGQPARALGVVLTRVMEQTIVVCNIGGGHGWLFLSRDNMESSNRKQTYPEKLVRTLTLRSGETITIRPIRPEDADIEREFIEGLSPRSSHMRFMGGVRRASDEMVRYFTDIDYRRHLALIAISEEGGRERQVAVGRFFTSDDGESCEFAIAVADAWQGKGIGYEIMTDLIREARARNLVKMFGSMYAYNDRMIALVRELGFEISDSPVEKDLVDAVLYLGMAV